MKDDVFRLMQALLGVISPNFRMVYISNTQKVCITVILEKESAEDREEIQDMATEFEALQPKSIDYDIVIKVDSRDINWPDDESIVVYKRREDL